MRTFWEDLSKRIGETAESVSNKAGEAVEIQKLKSQIRALERGTEEDLIDLGRMVYEYFEARILYGYYKYGESLPSINKICQMFHLAQATVRAAWLCWKKEDM